MADESYTLVAVGTGFATSFFLHEYLRHCGPGARILVLERGQKLSHQERLGKRFEPDTEARGSFVNATPIDKDWYFSFGWGGSSQCWWACTPRMLPNDFRLHEQYGVGRDWPLRYDDLEPYYCEAEDLMRISGDSDDTPFPRSRPYPEPPHRFSKPDEILKRAWPKAFFHQPAARPRTGVGGRVPCCNNGTCGLCPIDSKFTVVNGMASIYSDPRVELLIGAEARHVETRGDVATHVVYTIGAETRRAAAEQVALGANALFNPYLLLRSGLDGPAVGRGLVEQAGMHAWVKLDGLDNFQGSTSVTGNGYTAYDGPHRRERAAALIETWNIPMLRNQRGKWRQQLVIKIVFEDLRQDRNRVLVSSADPERPVAHFEARSSYTMRGVAAAREILEEFVAPLPVEAIDLKPEPVNTEAHILGTHVMGKDPNRSVVDDRWTHHRIRNLQVMGGGSFPTAAPANPTLTLSALAIRSARLLYGSQG